ncbi:MAG: rhodanese-like domain-containing protein, partial [Armatimonadota bacterium]|nr:rhodanese-like domain-containing protein [Armatimonadota bacterium]
GQATTFLPGSGCYRCLFPTPPPPGAVPSCAEGGVIGALAGFMGTLQALETVKLLLGRGDVLVNRLLIFDALSGEVRTLRWNRNPNCPVCGDHPTITALIDYEAFCGVPTPAEPRPPAAIPSVPEVSVAETQMMMERGEAVLIDVREQWEWRTARIPGAVLIPLGEISRRADEIPAGGTVIVYCATGRRSAIAVETLRRAGHQGALNMAGGIVEWMNQEYPVESG